MIITAIIAAILSYIVIGAVLFLDLTIYSRLTDTSEISTEIIGTGHTEGAVLAVHEQSALQSAA